MIMTTKKQDGLQTRARHTAITQSAQQMISFQESIDALTAAIERSLMP